ncbi:MAG: amidohydrolase family protein [Nitrospira sp.]|nr:amidohydrolase family protein [Nitrospira sp.]
MIIDAHLHLDEKVDGTAIGAVRELNRQLEEAAVDRALVLHLEIQPWSAAEVAEAISKFPRIRAFINVHPHGADPERSLREGIEGLGYIGLKLHPRLQRFGVDDDQTVRLVKAAGEMNVPVLIDAFPDGTHLMQGFSPLRYASLAKQCPGTRIIWAHMGGHHVMDFMMLAKRLPNVYFDISYSLLYYQMSSIPGDMIYAMRSMKFDRIFYGSDYPDRSVAVTLELSRQFMQSQGLSEEVMTKILGLNARDFFGWDDL